MSTQHERGWSLRRRREHTDDQPLGFGDALERAVANRLYPHQPVQALERDVVPEAPTPLSTVLDRTLRVDGTVRSTGDVRIDGALEGEVVCRGLLYVGAGARVGTRVSAGSVVVGGSVDGTIECARCEALGGARLRGTLTTRYLVVHEGAAIDAQVTMANGLVGS